MAVVAELLVKIGADITGLNSALGSAAGDVGSFQSRLEGLGSRATAAGGALTAGITAPVVAMAAGLVAAAVNVGNFADELLDLVDQTGLSTAALQEFRHVALVAGVAPDTLANAAIKLTTALQGSGEQTKQMQGALTALGVSALNADGGLRSMDALLPDIITGLQGMGDSTQRNILAADIFGRSWAELAPIMGLGAEGMAAARLEAQSLGLVLSGEALESADAFRVQVETLKASLGAAVMQIGVAAIPILTSLAGLLQNVVVPAIITVAGLFDSIPAPVLAGGAAMLGLAAAIGPVLLAVGTAIKLLPVLQLGFTVITGPIGAVVLAFGALVTAGVLVWKNWDEISAAASKAFKAIKDTVGGAIDAVAEKFEWFTGPVSDLIESVAGLASEVTGLFVDLGKAVIGKVTEISEKVVEWLVTKLAPLAGWITDKIVSPVVAKYVGFKTEVIRIVTDLYNGVKMWLVDRFTAIVDGIKAQIDKVRDFFAGLREELVGHSIVTDMVTEIGGEFTRMGGLMETETSTAVSKTTTAFGGLSGTLDTIAGIETDAILGKFKGLGITLPDEVAGLVGKIGEKWGAIKSVLELPLLDTFQSTLDKWRGYAEGIIDIIKGTWNAVGKFIEAINKFFDKGGQFGGPFGGGQFGQPGVNTSSVPMTPFGDPASAGLLSRIADTLDAIEDKEWAPQIVVNVQGSGGAWATGAGSGSASIAGIDQQLGIMGIRRNTLLTGDNSI